MKMTPISVLLFLCALVAGKPLQFSNNDALNSIHLPEVGPLPASNLLVEYLQSPVYGLDVPAPRFSWQIAHTTRGQNQTAYHIEVFAQPSVSVWNSGLVNSSQTSQINYVGTTLESDLSYFWQVTWWDSDGVSSAVSAPAYFDTGIFNESLWIATWIGGANQLRTEFTLPGSTNPLTRARLFIVGVGYYVARINGGRVGDHVLGPWPQYESRTLYDVYDVTDMLVPGDNAIAVTLANGFYADPSVRVGNIALICQISVSFADGTHQWVAKSDFTWKVVSGPVTYDNVYIGMNYDARLATPGWDKPGYNDGSWQAATAAQPTPPGKLQAYLAYPQRKVQTYSPINSWNPAPGIYVYDFGQNMAGWSQIRAVGPAGTTITIQHSEAFDVFTRKLLFLYGNAPMVDNFTLAGTGEWEYFEPELVYHGFQYVQITGYPGVPTTESVQAFYIHSDFPVNGGFESSNDTLNSVDRLTRNSAISNFQSIPTDCPTREKRGWLGDAQVSMGVQMQYWDMGAAYTKFVQDIHDSQTKINNGNVGDTAPWYNWGSTPADPAWGSAFTLLWYWSYQTYNDTRMLSTHYDAVKWYVSTIVAQSNNATGLLEWSRYGDWCSVAINNGCQYASPIVSTFYQVLQYQMLIDASQILGFSNDTDLYTKLLANVNSQFNPNYYFGNNYTYGYGSQTLQLLPLVLGLVPADQYNNVVNYLLNDILNVHSGHLTVGIVGAKYLLSTLTDIGRSDVAFIVATQTTYPSWQNFAENGATTLWENWQDSSTVFDGSRNHIMFGGQATWYYETVAGISMTPGTVGYADVTINPGLLDEPTLTYASASLNTYNGQVSSSWSVNSGTVCTYAEEHTVATLTCPRGVIEKIDFASFGLPAEAPCGSLVVNPSCNAPSSVQVVSKWCLGNATCSVPASVPTFGGTDPCVDVMKALAISATCTGGNMYSLQTVIPTNTIASVYVSKFSLSNATITESGANIWENGQYVSGTSGILWAVDNTDSVIFRVGGGSYNFQTSGFTGTTHCASFFEGERFEAACPAGAVVARVSYAHFGEGNFENTCQQQKAAGGCSIGSSKHTVERNCLHKNSCAFDLRTDIFGDVYRKHCGTIKHVMHAEFVCSYL